MGVAYYVLSLCWALLGAVRLFSGEPYMDYLIASGVFYIAAKVRANG